MTATEIIQVLIVDDHPIVRHGMATLIEQEEDLKVCGEAGDATQALEIVQRLRPHVAILDVSLAEGDDGLHLIEQIRREHPTVRILVVSMHDVESYAQRAIKAGAIG